MFKLFDEINKDILNREVTNTSLSSGQMQKVGFIRAILSNVEILLLDESTSNLDKKTEAKIFEEFMKLKNLKTLIVITHKMLNYQYFDKIISIKNKKINIQKGNAN